MSQEARTIRPFDGTDELERLIMRSRLAFGADVTVEPGSVVSVDLDPHEFLLRPVEVLWAASENEVGVYWSALRVACDPIGVEPHEAALLVTAQSRFLRVTEVAALWQLDQLPDGQHTTRLDSVRMGRALRSPNRGFTVGVHVVLTEELEHLPLRPWRSGTVLATASFTIDSTLGNVLFRPRPLDDEARADLQLPKKTMRYVHLGDHDPTLPQVGQDEPEFYVDDTILAELVANSRSAPSKALQIQLAHDFVTAIVFNAALRDLDGITIDDLAETLLDRVLRLLAGTSRPEAKLRFLDMIRNRPQQVVAWAEDVLGITAAMKDAVKGSDE